MSYRQLVIAKKAILSIKNDSISIEHDNHTNLVPVKDVAIIVVDHCEVMMTSVFFSRCAEEHIVTLICGDKHYPYSITQSINQHYRPFHVYKFQLNMKDEHKAILAEQLIRNKIYNQICVLEYHNNDENALQLLRNYFEEVEGNDHINREGTAAKVFFNSMYGKDFIRFSDDNINYAMNYGYGILRSAICRSVNMMGLNSYIGVNHKGNENPFNLVYDLIEPFRPLVDYYVATNKYLITASFSIIIKKELVNLLNARVNINGKTFTVQYAIELLTKSFLNSIEFGTMDLVNINIVPINFDKHNEFV